MTARALSWNWWPLPYTDTEDTNAHDTINYQFGIQAVAGYGTYAPYYMHTNQSGNVSISPYSGDLTIGVTKEATAPQRWFDYDFAITLSGRAQSKVENDDTRSAWVYDDLNGEWSEELLPKFNEFIEVEYPKPLPESDAVVPIYTITNCASEAVARSVYGDIFIRKVTPSKVDSSSKSEAMEVSGGTMDLDVAKMFREFSEANAKTYDKETLDACARLLGV